MLVALVKAAQERTMQRKASAVFLILLLPSVAVQAVESLVLMKQRTAALEALEVAAVIHLVQVLRVKDLQVEIAQHQAHAQVAAVLVLLA